MVETSNSVEVKKISLDEFLNLDDFVVTEIPSLQENGGKFLKIVVEKDGKAEEYNILLEELKKATEDKLKKLKTKIKDNLKENLKEENENWETEIDKLIDGIKKQLDDLKKEVTLGGTQSLDSNNSKKNFSIWSILSYTSLGLTIKHLLTPIVSSISSLPDRGPIKGIKNILPFSPESTQKNIDKRLDSFFGKSLQEFSEELKNNGKIDYGFLKNYLGEVSIPKVQKDLLIENGFKEENFEDSGGDKNSFFGNILSFAKRIFGMDSYYKLDSDLKSSVDIYLANIVSGNVKGISDSLKNQFSVLSEDKKKRIAVMSLFVPFEDLLIISSSNCNCRDGFGNFDFELTGNSPEIADGSSEILPSLDENDISNILDSYSFELIDSTCNGRGCKAVKNLDKYKEFLSKLDKYMPVGLKLEITAKQETGFKVVDGSSGEIGIFQIMPQTGRNIIKDHLPDYLKNKLKEFLSKDNLDNLSDSDIRKILESPKWSAIISMSFFRYLASKFKDRLSQLSLDDRKRLLISSYNGGENLIGENNFKQENGKLVFVSPSATQNYVNTYFTLQSQNV